MARLHRIAFILVALVAALAVAPRRALAVGEQTGRIKGLVTEATTGAPLGGIDITATSPALIGGPRNVQANDDGTYELADLPPGPYDVTVSFAGTNPIVRRVKVRQGETAPLNVKWSAELKDVKTYNVVEETHLTKPDSTQTGTVLGADTEARIATGRSYQSVLTQVAGVSDPAGRGIPNIKGANRLSNHYLVDGMDITDSVTNNFSQQVNFDAIGSVEVITGGMEAQYNAIGGVINLNTMTGSDQLHIDTSLYVNSDKLSVGPQTGSQIYEGTLPFSTAPALSAQSYQANLSVSGPLIKHRLWISASMEYDYRQSQIPIGPPLNVQHPPRREHDFFPRIKLTFAPNSKHRVTLSANADPALVYNRAQTNNQLPIAEYGQSQGGAFTVLQYDYFASAKTTFNIQSGFNYDTVSQHTICDFGGPDSQPMLPQFGPKNYTCNLNQPAHVNQDDQTIWYNDNFPTNDDRRYTVQFDPSLSMRGKWLGEHDAKIGIQSRYVYHSYTQHTPGGSVYTESGGGPGEAGLCDPDTGTGCNKNTLRTDQPDFGNHQSGFGIGAYVQDRWRVWKRLVLLPGIRFDYGLTKNSLGQTVSSLFGFGPRLGATVDLTGDAKTIFSVFYGRATETLNLLPASRADTSAVSNRYRWDPTQNAFVFDSSSGGPGGYILDPHATTPHTDEFSTSIMREIFRNSVAGVNYTYKQMSNIWDAVEVNQVWDPSGVRVIGYANGMPQKVYKYTTPDGNWRTYQGIDFTIESRPTPHWDLYAAYTLSWLYGPGADEVFTVGTGGSAFYNPRQYRFYDGFLPEDQRHQFKVHGSYEWRGLVLGANFSYASGTPLTKLYYNQSDGTFSNKRTPQGTDPGAAANDPNAVAEFRLPDTYLLNIRVSYDAVELIHQHIILIADLFNVFNTLTPTGLTTTDGALFAQANRGRLQPFHVQLGLRYLY
jgi:hypothetical protein